jgi:hypothetical protein
VPGVVWYTPVISALGRLRHEEPKFEASLGYVERPNFNKTKNTKQKNNNKRGICDKVLGKLRPVHCFLYIYIYIFFFFLMALGFELRTSHWLGRHSTT